MVNGRRGESEMNYTWGSGGGYGEGGGRVLWGQLSETKAKWTHSKEGEGGGFRLFVWCPCWCQVGDILFAIWKGSEFSNREEAVTKPKGQKCRQPWDWIEQFFLTNIKVTTTIPLRDKVNPKDHQYKIERLPHMSLASESQKIRLAPNLAAPQPWFSTTQPSYPPPTHPKPSYSQNFQQRETLKVWRWFIVLEKWFTPVSKRVGRRVLNGTYSKYWSHWPEWHIQKARRLHHLHWQWGHHHGHVTLTNCVQLGPFEVGLSLS